jgi:hypothetical protein
MTEQEIIEGNNLIAEYLGVDINYSDTVYKDSRSELRHIIDNRDKSEGLLFHCSYDWIMPVVMKAILEKIRGPYDGIRIGCRQQGKGVSVAFGLLDFVEIKAEDEIPILAVWSVIVQYLKN